MIAPKIPLKTVLALLQVVLVIAVALARALASDSDGGRRITPGEWARIAREAWQAIRDADLHGDDSPPVGG